MGVNVPRTFSATARLHKERGYEVDDFLCHAYENGIDIDRYIILDDSKDFLPGQPLIWCDPEYGFSYANYVEACKQLGLQEPSVILF
jgi:hypothetical protein